MRELLDAFSTENCPRDYLQVGGDSDGSYFLPNDLEGIRLCISPGVGDSTRFEEELLNCHGIASVLFDGTVSARDFEKLPDGITFVEKMVGESTGPLSISLDDIVSSWAPNAGDLLLQMDIEGAEFDVLLATQSSTIRRFRIAVIEFHNLGSFLENHLAADKIFATFKKLLLSHDIFWMRANNCCGQVTDPESGKNIPDVLEVTFIRKGVEVTPKVPWNESSLYAKSSDLRNDLLRAPILLNSNWLAATPSSSQEMDFFRFHFSGIEKKNSADFLRISIPTFLLLPEFRSELFRMDGDREIVWLTSRQELNLSLLPKPGFLEMEFLNLFDAQRVSISERKHSWFETIKMAGPDFSTQLIRVPLNISAENIVLEFERLNNLLDGRNASVAITGFYLLLGR